MSRSKPTSDPEVTTPPLRLRIPAALAVTLLGAGATVAMSFGACQETPQPEPIDAGRIFMERDSGADDAGENLIDAGIDAPDETRVDAAMADAYIPDEEPEG